MYKEAINDGIKVKNLANRTTIYYPHCLICGEEIASISYKHEAKYVCNKCKTEKFFSEKAEKLDEGKSKKDKNFDNAVKRIRKISPTLGGYETAIEKIHKNLYRDGWFQSTEEIMVAIQLVKENVKARHQVQFGRYRADFVLPDEKIVLEVDGITFHNNYTAQKEKTRDSLITLALGPEWEVIRITDQMINTNITRLISAMRKARDHRKLLRNQNSGEIPEWYSQKIV
jgi:very-short-patch-repair endonuclease